MMELDSHFGPMLMDDFRQPAKTFREPVVIKHEPVMESLSPWRVNTGSFYNDQPHAALGDSLVMIQAARSDKSFHCCVISGHGRADQAVSEPHGSDLPGFKELLQFHS